MAESHVFERFIFRAHNAFVSSEGTEPAELP